ncbi:MAG: polyprenyl synthetase family protein [Actinobacteria bacterium]|nr:polyprenyl synthetase family protein [Actinomycetota bacterium]
MKLNDTASLLSVIEQDLARTREQLQKNASSGHKLLADHAGVIDDLPLAKLLFITASFGTYRSEELRWVAVGIELLRLAADKHYPPAEVAMVAPRNLYLVSADYYYAQAISLAARLNKERVIEYMVKAIAELAEAEVLKHREGTIGNKVGDKSFSLFRAAVKLGALLGECPLNLTNSLTKFASSFGLIYQAVHHPARADLIGLNPALLTDARDRALADLRFIPAAQYRFLEELISF